jgi:hypothetical protein
MFIVIPAGVGVVTSLLAERFLRDGSWFARSRLAFASLVLAIPVGLLPVSIGTRAPLAFLAEVVVLVVALIAYRRRQLSRVWSSAPVVWLGQAALAAAAVVFAVELTRDVTAILRSVARLSRRRRPSGARPPCGRRAPPRSRTARSTA